MPARFGVPLAHEPSAGIPTSTIGKEEAMARRPRWSLNCVRESAEIYTSSVSYLIDQLEELPRDANVDAYYGEIEVYWYRDMTDAEYRREVAKRKEDEEARAVADRGNLERLAAKLGVKVVE